MKKEEYLSKLKDIIYGMKIKKWAVEGEFSVALSLTQIYKSDVYIYGAGKDIFTFVKYLLDEGVNLIGVIDRNDRLFGKKIFSVPIITPDEFIKGGGKT